MHEKPIIRFTHRDSQIVIDLSCFTEFPSLGYKESLVLANRVYLRCLQLYPEMETDCSVRRATLYMKYKDSGVTGPTKRQSVEHFESTVLFKDHNYVQLNEALKQVRRLAHEGIGTVLSPNVREWSSANDSGHSTTARNIREGPPESMLRPNMSPPVQPQSAPPTPSVMPPQAPAKGGGR